MESRRASSAEHATLRHELEATKYSLVAAEEREKAARERVQKVEEFLTQARRYVLIHAAPTAHISHVACQ